jgi:hypothetical protein
MMIEYEVPFHGFYESEDYYHEVEDDDEVDWKATHLNTAKQHTRYLALELGVPMEFVEVKSPKFYNFETDKIVVQTPIEALIPIRERLLVDEDFAAFVKEVCASRSGFISFVSNNLDEWGEWDYREYTVAFMYLANEGVLDTVRESLYCNTDAYTPIHRPL